MDGSVTGFETEHEISGEILVHPNPVREEAVFTYNLPVSGSVEIKIYEISGKAVMTFNFSEEVAGDHFVSWELRNTEGYMILPGIYV